MTMPLGGFWKKFLDLIPLPERQTGKVIGVYSQGRYAIELLGGGQIECSGPAGQYVIGDRVFLRSGTVEAKAPPLSAVVIDV